MDSRWKHRTLLPRAWTPVRVLPLPINIAIRFRLCCHFVPLVGAGFPIPISDTISPPTTFGIFLRPSRSTARREPFLGNWEFGGILTLETGTPFTVTIQGDPLGENNGDPFQYPDRSYGPGCSTAVNPGNPNQYVKLQCFSPPKFSTLLGNERRNSLTGPGIGWPRRFSVQEHSYPQNFGYLQDPVSRRLFQYY